MSKEEPSEEKPSGITPRDFLKGIAVGAFVTGAVATGVVAATWPAAPPAPPSAVTKTETVTRTTTAPATTVTTTVTAPAPVGVPAAKMYVASDSAICGGCFRCQMACSLFHYGECNLELASVHVTKDVFTGDYEVEACRQCAAPECLAACPVKAIYVDEKTGARLIDATKCTGCRLCEKACLFQMIGYNPATKKCFKCDLCGGDPQCVANCPHAAVTIVKT